MSELKCPVCEHKWQPAKPPSNTDTFTLEEGQAVLQWPSLLSADDYEDLKDWLALALRKIKRTAIEKG